MENSSRIIGVELTNLLYCSPIPDSDCLYRYHEHSERIHQVYRNFPDDSGEIQTRWACPYPVVEALASEFPSSNRNRKCCRLSYRNVTNVLFSKEEDHFLMDGAMFTISFQALRAASLNAGR